jgi:hypothetical protein
MALDAGRDPGRIVEFDLTPPALTDEQWQAANEIIQKELSSEYSLAINPGSQERVIAKVPAADLSPSWEVLRAHCVELARQIPPSQNLPLPPITNDNLEQLQLLPIRTKDQAADEDPLSVVISLKTGKVVSFNESAPEPDPELAPPNPFGMFRRLLREIGSRFRGPRRSR